MLPAVALSALSLVAPQRAVVVHGGGGPVQLRALPLRCVLDETPRHNHLRHNHLGRNHLSRNQLDGRVDLDSRRELGRRFSTVSRLVGLPEWLQSPLLVGDPRPPPRPEAERRLLGRRVRRMSKSMPQTMTAMLIAVHLLVWPLAGLGLQLFSPVIPLRQAQDAFREQVHLMSPPRQPISPICRTPLFPTSQNCILFLEQSL